MVLDIAGPVTVASDAKPATPEDLEETVRQIRAYGHRVVSIRTDIRDIAALRAAADRVEKSFGKIDIVVADAGIQRWKPLLEMEDAEWRDVIDNNLNGTANTVRAFAPSLVRRKRGRILEVGNLGADEVRGDGTRSVRHHGECDIAGPRRYGSHALRQASDGVHGETGQKPKGPQPTAQEAWDARAPTVPLKVGWLQPDDICHVMKRYASTRE